MNLVFLGRRYATHIVVALLSAALSEAVTAQSSRGRSYAERRPGLVVQTDIGLPELYVVGIGIITDDQWVLSVVGNGVLLRGAGFTPARGIGIQIGKSLKTDGDDGVQLPNSIVLEPSYLFKTPKKDGDGLAVSLSAGYANFERIGLNTHFHVGVLMSAAIGYHPLVLPCFKFGMNYNFPSEE